MIRRGGKARGGRAGDVRIEFHADELGDAAQSPDGPLDCSEEATVTTRRIEHPERTAGRPARRDELLGDERADHRVDEVRWRVPGTVLLAVRASRPGLDHESQTTGTRLRRWRVERPTVSCRDQAVQCDALPDLRPRRLGHTPCGDADDAPRARTGTVARHQRPHRHGRGRQHLPAAEPAAQPLHQRHAGPAQGLGDVPRSHRTEGAVHHRRRRQRRRRQEHLRQDPAGAARTVAPPSQGRPHHHRRVPVPERGARRARHHEPQGLPRVVRHAANCCSVLRQIKSGHELVEAPVYSHVVYDIVPDEKVVVRSPTS